MRSINSRLDRVETSISARLIDEECRAKMELTRRKKFQRGLLRFGYDINDPNTRRDLIEQFKNNGWTRPAQILESYTKDNLDG